ncbi:sarcosine oxidase subunit gamma [Ruegeria arenilitoris]|uniref:sarcosine oxidase subunit gamma n=1 Tax=Ruegeria arenilitoris TaxID=1173585 RepID=UPI001479A51B
MHKLKAITPLGRTEPKTDNFTGLSITENPARALATLTARLGHETACTAQVSAFIGCDLPGPGKSVVGETYGAIWIAPSSWMIEADHTGHELIAQELKPVAGETASVVEQTDAWCRFDITGSAADDLFERLCNVDVRAMNSDTATRTTIHHIGCYLWCRKAGFEYSVLGPRSSAGSLHHALVEVAQAVCPV